jgi:opacity protein-like surface antigen
MGCVLFAALFAVMLTTPAGAEWAVDLYGGGAFTERADVDAVLRFPAVDGRFTQERTRFEPSAAYGGRIGYWFDHFPALGFAADATRFNREVRRQTTDVLVAGQLFGTFDTTGPDFKTTAVSPLLMLRWPLGADAEHRRGVVQPYLLAGPSLFVTRLSHLLGTSGHDTARTIGATAGTGVAIPLTSWLSVFAEYRFTRESPTFSVTLPFLIGAKSADVDTTLNAHHLLFGVGLRF